MRAINSWLILGTASLIVAAVSFLTGYIGLGVFAIVIGGSIFILGLYMAWLVVSGMRRVDLGALPIALIFLIGIAVMVWLAFLYA
ncbi:MAG: hypothetical protein ACE5OY_07630 [Candidatus Bathyarchaeia archaeon]